MQGHVFHVKEIGQRAKKVMHGQFAKGAITAIIDDDYTGAPCPHGYCIKSRHPYIVSVPSWIKHSDLVQIQLANTLECPHPLAEYAEQRLVQKDVTAIVTYSGGKNFIDLVVTTHNSLRKLYALYGLLMSCDEEGLKKLNWGYRVT